jgi:predicted lipoprotein
MKLAFANLPSVVPANAGTQTPRTIDVRTELNPDQTQTRVVMGPRVRGDDEKKYLSHNRVVP